MIEGIRRLMEEMGEDISGLDDEDQIKEKVKRSLGVWVTTD